jgi:hypothetical protein
MPYKFQDLTIYRCACGESTGYSDDELIIPKEQPIVIVKIICPQ